MGVEISGEAKSTQHPQRQKGIITRRTVWRQGRVHCGSTLSDPISITYGEAQQRQSARRSVPRRSVLCRRDQAATAICARNVFSSAAASSS
jgi:hypothetical protein